jgi:hypothetical protein
MKATPTSISSCRLLVFVEGLNPYQPKPARKTGPVHRRHRALEPKRHKNVGVEHNLPIMQANHDRRTAATPRLRSSIALTYGG